MKASTFDTMLNDTYNLGRQARAFAEALEQEKNSDPSVAKMWHELADKLVDVVEHGDLMRSGNYKNNLELKRLQRLEKFLIKNTI